MPKPGAPGIKQDSVMCALPIPIFAEVHPSLRWSSRL